MKKKTGYSFLGIFILMIIVASIGIIKFNKAIFDEKANYLSYTAEAKPIHFKWASDSTADYYEAQAAMIIPVKMEGIKHQFYMQFDTGSPFTFIYEKDLISLKNMGLKISEEVQKGQRYVKLLELELGGNKLTASMVKILEGYGHTFTAADTIGGIKIGTIGSDFMANTITTIDFQQQKIQTYKQRPKWMAALPHFKPFDFQGRRIMLPAVIGGEEYELLYDSGCSAFGLITTKNRFESYADLNTELISYGANSWGNSIPIKNKATKLQFQLGNAVLNMGRVSYVDMYAWSQHFVTPFTRIGGWLGNAAFAESTIIFDTQKEEFLVVGSANFNKFLLH